MEQSIRLKKGDSTVTALHADFMNENVLDPIQAFTELTVLPTGKGKLVYAGATATLDLTALANDAKAGTWANPYLMELGPTDANEESTDTWDKASPPPGFDGVIIQVIVRKDPAGDFKHRRMTFNSAGVLVHISAEEPE